jgi:hypothetical protein
MAGPPLPPRQWGINMVSSDDSLLMQGGKLAAEKTEYFHYNRLGYVTYVPR